MIEPGVVHMNVRLSMMLSWVSNDVYDPTPEGVAMRYDSVQTSGFIDCTICSNFQVVLHTV